MERHILPNETRESRMKILRDSADKIENGTYYKRLSEEEIQAEREAYTSGAMQIGNHDKVLSEAKEHHKQRVKPIKLEMAINLHHLKTGTMEVAEELFLIADQALSEMGYYSGDGELIRTRLLTRDEKQLNIKFSQAE